MCWWCCSALDYNRQRDHVFCELVPETIPDDITMMALVAQDPPAGVKSDDILDMEELGFAADPDEALPDDGDSGDDGHGKRSRGRGQGRAGRARGRARGAGAPDPTHFSPVVAAVSSSSGSSSSSVSSSSHSSSSDSVSD